MNLISIAIACVVLVVGAYIGKKEIHELAQNENMEIRQEVLSTEDEEPHVDEGEASVSVDTQNSFETETPTQTPQDTLTPLPPSPVTGGGLNEYRYANSELLSQTASELHLKSLEDTDTVTTWYKEKVRAEGMNIKTFVTTKANEKVLNKLSGASANREVRVEITKEPEDVFCYIDVFVTTK
jgi:hypothetical protein